MTSTHPIHPAEPGQRLSQHELIRGIDGAIKHLTQAGNGPRESQNEAISSAVQRLTTLRDHHIPSEEEDAGDFSTLFDYMIDRLSISHSGLDIDPINEVSWLLRNLRDLLARPKHRGSPAKG